MGLSWRIRSNLLLGQFVTMVSLKTLFDLSSGIKFLTSVKLNLIQSRGIMYISGYLGSVILVIDLPTRSLLVYVSAIFLTTCVWFSARELFWHRVKKTFFPPPTQHSSSLIYSFRCVCGLLYIGRTHQRLDSRIRQGNYFANRIKITYVSSIAEHLINNCNCASSTMRTCLSF